MIINHNKADTNTFVHFSLSLHLADCQSVAMSLLLSLSAQPSAKEILQDFLKDSLWKST